MAQETERKFLVLNDRYKTAASRSFQIIQGYLSSDPQRSVRIRTKGDSAYITIKGATNPTGISRYEWEKEIAMSDAKELLALCEPGAIEKVRYEIKYGGHVFEVDEFFGDNIGLVIAEIELSDENEPFLKPEWLGSEVTGEKKYYNSMLSKNPYSAW